MQASQTKINQEVAVALERLNGRMEGAEQRIVALEDYRREEDKRRDDRIEKVPDNKRADIMLFVAIFSPLLYILVQIVSQHWH